MDMDKDFISAFGHMHMAMHMHMHKAMHMHMHMLTNMYMYMDMDLDIDIEIDINMDMDMDMNINFFIVLIRETLNKIDLKATKQRILATAPPTDILHRATLINSALTPLYNHVLMTLPATEKDLQPLYKEIK
jgi:hypothetical protein